VLFVSRRSELPLTPEIFHLTFVDIETSFQAGVVATSRVIPLCSSLSLCPSFFPIGWGGAGACFLDFRPLPSFVLCICGPLIGGVAFIIGSGGGGGFFWGGGVGVGVRHNFLGHLSVKPLVASYPGQARPPLSPMPPSWRWLVTFLKGSNCNFPVVERPVSSRAALSSVAPP